MNLACHCLGASGSKSAHDGTEVRCGQALILDEKLRRVNDRVDPKGYHKVVLDKVARRGMREEGGYKEEQMLHGRKWHSVPGGLPLGPESAGLSARESIGTAIRGPSPSMRMRDSIMVVPGPSWPGPWHAEVKIDAA